MATSKHYKHLELHDRIAIENAVTEGRPLSHIAQKLDISSTTISRELKRNRRDDGYRGGRVNHNRCIHRKTCSKKKLCDPDCKKKCPICKDVRCNTVCPDYEIDQCRRTFKAPWVCNGCPEHYACPLRHWTYSAKVAQAKADSRLIESRSGLDMCGHEIAYLEATVKEGLAKGQPVHHIFVAHPDLPCSERSFYRHVESEVIDVHKMDLRKKVKYKKRNKKHAHKEGFYEGRTYADYLTLDEALRADTVQMDCVEGAEEDMQALLTLHFASLRFQIYILLARKDKEHVVEALNWIDELCQGRFQEFFGLILADRGCEFDDIFGIEHALDGTKRCDVYYTDPQRPDQKGGCEKNHVELRKIMPKGTSIDGLCLNQWIVSGMCSHANSSMRRSIGNASPAMLAFVSLPASLLEGIGIDVICADDVDLTSGLIDRLRNEQTQNQEQD